MISKRLATILVLTSLLLTAASSRAELRLPALFSDNMVLQQRAAVPVWGWADDAEVVTAQFRSQKVSTKVKDGKWVLKFRNLKSGGPDTLTISTKTKTIQLTSVLVGEVWVCSGQSNMEWPLNKAYQPEADIAASANPNIRLFTVPKFRAASPTNDVRGSWSECGPKTVSNFSAVAYYFGRDLQKARGAPVGLIHTSWGGSPAEAWISSAVLQSNQRYQKEIIESVRKGAARIQGSPRKMGSQRQN